MRRSKKILARTRKVRKQQPKVKRQTRHRGGRRVNPKPSVNANREAFIASITENVAGLQGQMNVPVAVGTFTNGGNNGNNYNEYNEYDNEYNGNHNNAQNEEISGLNLIYIKDLYDAIDGIEDEEEKKRMVKAVGGWLYAVFVSGPKKDPKNTKESIIESLQYETRKYLKYELDSEDSKFGHVMDTLFEVYNRIKSLDGESFAYSNMQEHYEEFQAEIENELGLNQ
jgi:hypothetical protein